MIEDAASQKVEIVIVRRRMSDDGAAGKGGAWKIAYADFVTAMMAFFLVMWLINASNEKTRAQVASYFNPIKLTDSSTGNRGLKDKKVNKTTTGGDAEEASAGGTPPAASDTREESALLSDPDKALSEIEAKIPLIARAEGGMGPVEGQVPSSVSSDSQPGIGDPFDPKAWEKRNDRQTAAGPSGNVKPEPQKIAEPEPADEKVPVVQAEKSAAAPAAQSAVKPDDGGGAKFETQKKEQLADERAMSGEIAKRLGTGLEDLPASVDVKWTDSGLLISLTDKQNFGMFRTGSAEPEPELVRLVTAIAGALANRPGYVVVRGHTDSRPYRNKKYDNWQLSTARAHFAQYMLVRGGLDEARIRRVEGLANREPRIPDDPQAPENRRIEILLGRDGQ